VTETVSLNFAIVKIKYKEQGDDGSSAAEYEMGFNVETNVAV
jgi:type VI protein secretion system component Hcp